MSSFRLLLEKTAKSRVICHSWCPTMDLVAFAGEDSSVEVHRLSWDLVFSNNGEKRIGQEKGFENISSMSWRPDGQVLVTGHVDGDVVLHASDGGEILMRLSKLGSGSITSLHWATLKSKIDSKISEIEKSMHMNVDNLLLPMLPIQDVSTGTDSTLSSIIDNFSSSLNVLISTNEDCTVVLNAFGGFELGRVQLGDAIPTQVRLSKSMTNIAFIQQRKEANNTYIGEMSIYDASILSKNEDTLHGLASRAAYLNSVTANMQTGANVLKEKWQSGRKLVNDKFQILSDLLKDHGENNLTARDEFVALLSGGLAGPALMQFLENTLGERGLVRLTKQIDSTYGECVNICVGLVKRATDRLLYAVNELLGLARWRDRYAPVGLSIDSMEKLLSEAQHLSEVVGVTYGSIVSARVQFGVFFKWLDDCIQKFNEEDEVVSTPTTITRADFATLSDFFGPNGAFENEITSNYLGTFDQTDDNIVSFLPSPVGGSKGNREKKVLSEGSLITVVSQFKSMVETALASPSEKMSAALSHTNTISLYHSSTLSNDPKFCPTGSLIGFVSPSNPSHFVLCQYEYRYSREDEDTTQPFSPSIWRRSDAFLSLKGLKISINGTIVDWMFGKDDSLVAIVDSNGEYSLSVFDYADCEMVPLASGVVDNSCGPVEALLPTATRLLDIVPHSLGVGLRGTASVIHGNSRKVQLFDLEDEEEDQNEMDADELDV